MRFLLALMLMSVASGAKADMCEEIHHRSLGRIHCVKDDFGYTLKYQDWITRRITLSSDQYDHLIGLLCHDGNTVRETWRRPFGRMEIRVIHCNP